MTKLSAGQVRHGSGSNASRPRIDMGDGVSAPDSKHVCASQGIEPILGAALFRVLRAMVFEQRPLPELNALPMAQLRLLWAVRFHPGSTMKDLSERLGVSQSSVTELANRLVRRNLIARLPDPEDRRVIRLSTSDF